MVWIRRLVDGSLLAQADMDQQSIDQFMELLDLDDGSSLRVFDVGQGEPIVFLPMSTELNFMYVPQIEEFKSDYRIILYEPRLSSQSHFGIADRASEVVSLMKRLGLESTNIIAWSDTGSVAYYLSKRWPEKCRSIVFLGLADRYTFPQPLRFLAQLYSDLPIEGLVPSWLIARILGKYLGGIQVKPAWVAGRAAQVPNLSCLFKHSVMPNLTEHQPVAGEVHVPCVVICGDKDALVSVAQARRMADLLPNATQAVIIPGGEHFLGYVNGPAVNKVIREFYACLA